MHKKVFLWLFFLVVIQFSTFGQNIKYRDIKNSYTTSNYSQRVKDPTYSAFLAGTINYLLPGLGHVYVGEPLRGLCFFGGAMVATGVTMTGLIMSMSVDDEGNSDGSGRMLLYSGAGATLIIGWWGIFDVIKVARLKNIAISERNNHTASLNFYPSLKFGRLNGDDDSFVYGMTVSLTF